MSLNSEKAIHLPSCIQDPFRTALIEGSAGWISLLENKLISLVLFGSVSRGQAKLNSDIDLLVIAANFPKSLRKRRQLLLEKWEEIRTSKYLPLVEWNLIAKTVEEARVHSPLYLDMVEDAVIFFDRNRFFETILSEIRERMRILGSRRIFLEDGSWYWDLKPDYRFGEVIEI